MLGGGIHIVKTERDWVRHSAVKRNDLRQIALSQLAPPSVWHNGTDHTSSSSISEGLFELGGLPAPEGSPAPTFSDSGGDEPEGLLLDLSEEEGEESQELPTPERYSAPTFSDTTSDSKGRDESEQLPLGALPEGISSGDSDASGPRTLPGSDILFEESDAVGSEILLNVDISSGKEDSEVGSETLPNVDISSGKEYSDMVEELPTSRRSSVMETDTGGPADDDARPEFVRPEKVHYYYSTSDCGDSSTFPKSTLVWRESSTETGKSNEISNIQSVNNTDSAEPLGNEEPRPDQPQFGYESYTSSVESGIRIEDLEGPSSSDAGQVGQMRQGFVLGESADQTNSMDLKKSLNQAPTKIY